MSTAAPHVMLDLRMVEGALHGIARYALELARRLPALAPGWRFTGLLGPRGLPPGLGALTPSIPLVTSRAAFLSPAEQPLLTASLAQHRPDLFHATSFSLPALWPGPLVATLHDANHLALPQLYGAKQRLYYRLVVGPTARRARALITVSEFSRAELAQHLGLSPYRFQVIPQGVDPTFSPLGASTIETARQRMGVRGGYLLGVGNAKAYKNLGLLGRISDRLPLPLRVVAGATDASALGLPEGIRILSGLDEAQLREVYACASTLLFPSRYEGFGLPALEAMASGVPVIAADGSALREVVGGAGLLVPPDDEEGWIQAVLRLRRDPELRRELIEAGLARAARMTWELCAQRTLQVYRRALGDM